MNKIDINSFGFKLFKNLGFVIIILSTIFSFAVYGDNFITDVKLIGTAIPSESTLTISKSLYNSWSSIAPFQRHFRINMDRTLKHHTYALGRKKEPVIEGYKVINVELSEFRLLKKIRD